MSRFLSKNIFTFSGNRNFKGFLFLLIVPLLVSFSGTSFGALADFDSDGDVDFSDLTHFMSHWLDTGCGNPDWCDGTDMNRSTRVDISDYMLLSRDWLTGLTKVVNSNKAPMAIVSGPQGNIYVTDKKSNSVFIYDPDLKVTGEIKGPSKPIGLAVALNGDIYVGSSGNSTLEIYSPNGVKLGLVANDIELANDLKFDNDGNLYVADIKSHKVRVFSPEFVELPSITHENMKYPSALTIDYVDDGNGGTVGELYVSSFITKEGDPNFIKVFDLQGNLKRNFGLLVNKSFMGSVKWQGKYIRIQSMQVGPDGNLHVLDPVLNKCQIINKSTGSYIGYYGTQGTAAGQLNLPQDILILPDGRVIASNYRNKRVDVIHTLP